MAVPSLEHLKGRDIAGFRILAELGRGNNGIVYLARQLTLDREVALKLLLPELAAEPEYTRSILREARLAARLDHPNIVQALDAGSSPDGFCFFAMEYVPGRTLEDIRIHHPEELSFRFLLDLSIQLADALAYAWKHCRMIHGDIKPGNLLIRDGDRRLKLADLGLARISGVPGADEIVVTPLYAAPEVIRGEFAKVGQTSDIYSFGVMFYELAAGKPPFRGDTDFLIDAHQNLPPPPLWEANPDIDPELAGFVMQMLEKEPEHRPADWKEVAAFLRETRARLYSPGYAAKRQAQRNQPAALRNRRHPLLTPLLVVAFVLIFLLLGAFFYTAFRFLTEDTTLTPITITPEPPAEPLPVGDAVAPDELLKVALSGEAVRELPPPRQQPTESPQRAVATPPASPPASPPVTRPARPVQTTSDSAEHQSPPPDSVPPPPPPAVPPESVEPPAKRVFSPRISIHALRKRMQKLDRMLAQLNADDYPRKWREKAREVGAHSWLLLLQLATRDLPIPEPDRFEPTGANREADWISFGGMAGFIRVYPKMPPIRIARGFGAGLYRELRKARLLPAGLDGEFSRAFEFFVRERMGRTPIRALDNRILRNCNYSLPDFVDTLKDGTLARRLQTAGQK